MSGDVELNPGPLEDVERILSNVDDTTFVEDDWNTVIKVCSSLAASWENLGAFLGLSIGMIDAIKESPRISSAVGYLNEVLKHWIKQNYNTGRYGVPSWRTLLEGVARVDKLLFKTLAAEHSVHKAASASASSEVGGEVKTFEEFTQTTYVYQATSSSGDAEPQLSFPYLNLEGMTKEQKQHLHQRLYTESIDMIDKFQDLLSATTESLRKRRKSVKSLMCHLVGLGSLPPAYKNINLPEFSRQLPRLTKSKTIDEAMIVVGNYCSFFNYRMLERIINKLGTRQDRKNLSDYKARFSRYAERLVFECPSEVGTTIKGLANMYVTLDKAYDSYTLSSLELFVINLGKTLKISSGAVFILCRIDRGSLKLTFQLPYSVLGEIFPLPKEQAVALRGLGVRRLWLQGIPFDSETLGLGEETAEGDLVSTVTDLKVDDKNEDILSIPSRPYHLARKGSVSSSSTDDDDTTEGEDLECHVDHKELQPWGEKRKVFDDDTEVIDVETGMRMQSKEIGAHSAPPPEYRPPIGRGYVTTRIDLPAKPALRMKPSSSASSFEDLGGEPQEFKDALPRTM